MSPTATSRPFRAAHVNAILTLSQDATPTKLESTGSFVRWMTVFNPSCLFGEIHFYIKCDVSQGFNMTMRHGIVTLSSGKLRAGRMACISKSFKGILPLSITISSSNFLASFIDFGTLIPHLMWVDSHIIVQLQSMD